MSAIDLIILAFATILVFFLPGFIWSYVFFDSRTETESTKKKLSASERVLWSFALSVAIVPISFFIVNSLVVVPVNSYTILAFIAGLSGLGVLARYVLNWLGSG